MKELRLCNLEIIALPHDDFKCKFVYFNIIVGRIGSGALGMTGTHNQCGRDKWFQSKKDAVFRLKLLKRASWGMFLWDLAVWIKKEPQFLFQTAKLFQTVLNGMVGGNGLGQHRLPATADPVSCRRCLCGNGERTLCGCLGRKSMLPPDASSSALHCIPGT